MNNILSIDHHESGRRRGGDVLFAETTSQRFDFMHAAAGLAMQSVGHENPNIVREAPLAVSHNQQPIVADAPQQPSYDSETHMQAARAQVSSSLPTDTQGYIPYHPRIVAANGVDPQRNPLFMNGQNLMPDDTEVLDPALAGLGYQKDYDVAA